MKDKFARWNILYQQVIGEYEVIKYADRTSPDGGVWFTGSVNGVSVNESWQTLDEALVAMIVIRSIGKDHRTLSEHFILGVRSIEERKKT
jgi:hypothetical protein